MRPRGAGARPPPPLFLPPALFFSSPLSPSPPSLRMPAPLPLPSILARPFRDAPLWLHGPSSSSFVIRHCQLSLSAPPLPPLVLAPPCDSPPGRSALRFVSAGCTLSPPSPSALWSARSQHTARFFLQRAAGRTLDWDWVWGFFFRGGRVPLGGG